LGNGILTGLIFSSETQQKGRGEGQKEAGQASSSRTWNRKREVKKKKHAKHRDDKGGISSIAAAKRHDRVRK